MKYFKKFLILGLFALCGVSFSSAFNTQLYYPNNLSNAEYCTGKMSVGLFTSNTNGYYLTDFLSNNDYCNSIISDNHTFIKDILVCARLIKSDRNQSSTATLVNNFVGNLRRNAWFDVNGNGVSVNNYPCLFFKSGSTPEFGFTTSMNFANISGFNLGYSIYTLDNLNTLFNVLDCPDQYTSLQCQTEYNLIPIEDVTKNYCEINFDLIDPLDCPNSSGTGDLQWSALYVNNVQYNGAPNLYVNINDLLDYSMTYVSGSAVIDVDGYKADTGYMADILTIQEYHPSSEDFTSAFVGFLTLALPYVVVILFVVFVRKLIRRIFKS